MRAQVKDRPSCDLHHVLKQQFTEFVDFVIWQHVHESQAAPTVFISSRHVSFA